MTALYTCITQQHDLRLVALAAVICSLGIWAAFALGHEAFRSRRPRQKYVWVLAATASATWAIWATHFIAMIAFDPGAPFLFAPATTALSFLVALALVGAAALTVTAHPSTTGRVIGGALGGLAISAMHYTGMSALRVQGTLSWDGPTVVASVTAGVVLAALAAVMPTSRRRAVRTAAPVALVLAVCLDHFIAMSAVSIAFDPKVELPANGIDLASLGVIVSSVALGVLSLSAAAVWLKTRDRRQRIAEDDRTRDMADVSIEGLLICEDGRIVGLNQSLAAMIGAERQDVIGRPVGSLLPVLAGGAAPGDAEIDADLRVERGGVAPVKIVSKSISIDGGRRTVIAVRDQRERIKTEAEMRRLAHEDPLTGLANRYSFQQALTARFESCRGSERGFALMMLDLDRFKLVNDTLGHGVGDAVLNRVGQRIGRTVREGEMLARLGGDEFAIVFADAIDPAHVNGVAERVIETLGRPFIIDGQIIEIGVSAGVAFAPTDGATAEALSRSADLALYRAKEEGRGVHRFFEPEMDARMQARRTFERDLRRAVACNEFYVVYQPQLDSAAGRFNGAEALVRWRHPERGVVSPAEFIPLAEELGLIGAIGEFVLRTACAEAKGWPEHICVAVNLSPAQLKDNRFVAAVAGVLKETGLPGERLELELTENALLRDEGQAIRTLHELRALGIRISMDDFGTGYSSISYLRRFPFDKIKIDQSFVRQLPHDPDSMAIVQAVATLGVQLGMRVTAEGVETTEQQAFATAKGCSQLQGYLFSKPIGADELASIFNPVKSAASAA